MSAGVDRGTFITFEGGEGGGKSTHILFLSEALKAAGRTVLTLREPGGTAIGEALRALVLDPAHREIAPATELFLYEAARSQLTAEVIRPALDEGTVVLCDRFSDSTVAYQGAGRGIDLAFIEEVNGFATGGLTPDRTLVLACGDGSNGLFRATHDSAPDRLEQEGEGFHDRVNRAFLEIAADHPARVRLIDSTQPKGLTAYTVFKAVADLFEWQLPARTEVVEALEVAGSGGDPFTSTDLRALFADRVRGGVLRLTPQTFVELNRFTFHG